MAEVIERNDPVVVREHRSSRFGLILLVILALIVIAVVYSRYHPFSVNGTKNISVPVPNVHSSQAQ